MIALEPLGDRALLARFRTESEAARWARAVRQQGWPGVRDVVLAYQTAAVFADPDEVDLEGLEGRLRKLRAAAGDEVRGALVTLPVLYDGADLHEAAERLGLAVDELVGEHSGQEYTVFAVGFQPGFPYAGYLPRSISGLARRTPPRVRVPAGSVAIAGRQTGVYPRESPGGWHLLGRTPLTIVDVKAGRFPIRAGDRLRFVSITEDEFNTRQGELL